MKLQMIIVALLLANNSLSQEKIKYACKQFFAINVANADSTSKWYEDVFQMKLIADFKSTEKNIRVRIIGNKYLKVEIIQNGNLLSNCSVKKGDSIAVRGCFKASLHVKKISLAEAYLRKRNVTIKHARFEDKETHTRSFIIEDPNGFMIQILDEMK